MVQVPERGPIALHICALVEKTPITLSPSTQKLCSFCKRAIWISSLGEEFLAGKEHRLACEECGAKIMLLRASLEEP